MITEAANHLSIHFFTIVLNGRPFIEYHADVFAQLSCDWHWHVIEGVASLTHDTAWSAAHGGRISDALHRDGRSNDGTSEYLDDLARRYPERITLYRKPVGEFWDGKIEMVRQPLPHLPEQCLLWQVDADELWTVAQIETARQMFIDDPERTAGFFLCSFFVGEQLVLTGVDNYGNNRGYEWLRLWRYRRGDLWVAHEPPRLARQMPNDGRLVELVTINAFLHEETAVSGLIFQHFAYVTRAQLAFKEIYYGYEGAVASWEQLNAVTQFPVRLANFFPWVHDGAGVELSHRRLVRPLAHVTQDGSWAFEHHPSPAGLEGAKYLLQDAAPLRRRTVMVDGLVAPLPLSAVRTVAVVLLLGPDEVTTNTWVLRELRASLPDAAHITVFVAGSAAGNLLRHCPYLNRIVTLPDDGSDSCPQIRSLFAREFDLAVAPLKGGDDRTSAVIAATGALIRVGFAVGPSVQDYTHVLVTAAAEGSVAATKAALKVLSNRENFCSQ